ncbi:MAG: DUF3302 domain-containing protein [Immundisolibacteraceae bacterium]|nr:DUF3302 domain-containing protein [Immundisolibacteraceae bacterium]
MLDYFALALVFIVAITLFYGIIVIHDIPYEIAKHRNHPHQDALHVAGWVSLFTLHVLWPFLWIWATLYREDRGWGFAAPSETSSESSTSISVSEFELLKQQVEELRIRLAATQSSAEEG